MFKMIWPIALVVISNCVYNICAKSTPENANAFLALAVTYLVAATVSVIAFMVGKNNGSIASELKSLNWTSILLGISIVGLEFGYISIYRVGWKISAASLTANICLACVLVFVGVLLYKEVISWKQIIGICVCAVGLILIGK